MAEKEYIERVALLEDLQEELDTDTPMYTKEQNECVNKGLKIAIRRIKRAKAPDVVEVVRCKDCANSEPLTEHEKGIYKKGTVTCAICYTVNDKRSPDWYCPMGERKKK